MSEMKSFAPEANKVASRTGTVSDGSLHEPEKLINSFEIFWQF